MKKRILCFLTSFIMIFSLVANVSVTNVNAESTTAENQSEISADDGDVSIEGTNSFGNLLTDSLEEKMNQQEENNGCNIFSIEMIDDSTAAVSFETLQDCMLVVGIYDEAGETMLASGSIEVYAGETDTYVDIETDSMPEYFYLKAFLIDTDCFRPVCNAYESPNYTQEMQEFLAKTTEDFDQEKVLNFDDDNTNNFAVFSEDTKVIPQTEDTNDVVSVDDENNVYVVENADSSITSLQAGDTFAYKYGDNDVLIVKVADIKLDGTTATITGEDTSLEEAFDYIKIDTESNSADAQVDASNLEDGITYEGMIESEDDSEVQTYGADLEGSKDLSLSFEMNDKKIGSAKVSGSVEFKLSVSAKVYISSSYQYIELKLEYSAKTVLSLSDKGNGKMPLAYMGFSPIPGLIIEVTPSIVLETSVKAEVSGTLKGCVGFKTSNTEGMVNLTKSPTFNPEIKIEGTIFVGISLEPKVKIISDKIASASMTAKVGAEVKGVLSKKLENNANSIHECKNCIDGDIKAKVTLSFEAKLMNWDSLKFTLNLVNWSVKICDFYFSYDFAEFAFTSCPHYKYKVTVLVTDSDFNKVQGATVKIDDEEYKTDENGCVTVYFNNGNYRLAAQKSEVGKAQTTLTVDDNAVKKSMCLNKNSPNGDGNTGLGVSVGAYHSAAITKDGSLYTWGWNGYGQLGDGTKTDKYIPKKIMDNVKLVSLGDFHSAAITKDGSLYTWGRNNYGQLGNRTTTDSLTPIKIMDNVQSVSLGGYHSAAITKDGRLYTWGSNAYGQLGNGTAGNLTNHTPIKVMDNVQSVSLGDRYCAAITKDGSLYTWGENIEGQLGNGTAGYTPNPTPIKVMDNVQSVNLGSYHSAAITKDGSLYTWGDNNEGQLGNGTTTNSLTPIKIMDNVQSVSFGYYYSAAITKDGSLYTWGDNYGGTLGNGTTTDSLTPIKIMDNVQSVSFGGYHGAAIAKDDSLYTWGDNENGQLGNGTTTDSRTPVKITIPVEIATASVTSLPAPTCTLSTLSVVDTSIKSFSDMRANEIYNVYAIKSADAENILEADNLLYITQVLSDENGTLSVPYGFDEEYDDPVWLVVPMTQTDISSAEITVDDLKYTGENQFVKPVVKLNGETLVEGESYYLEKDYSAVEPGAYTVIVTGSGLYKGSVEASYKVIENNGVALRGSNLTLNGNIGLNFYFEIDESLKDSIFADQTSMVRFTLADGSTVDVAANTGLEDTSAMEGLTLYRYSCELTAKQMADTVTVQFIMNDKVIAEYEHSVVDYAKIIIANTQNAYSAEVIALVKAMLNYGANAQLNFGYNTENLANSLTDADGNAMITEEEKDLSSVTTATFEPYKATGTTIDGLGNFAAANLVLKSETTLKVYFKPVDGITPDMITFKVGDNEVTATEYGEYLMISIPNIKASALNDKYVITVTSKTDSTKTGTFDAYVYSYCYSVLKDSTGTYTEQLKDTLRALYIYNVVANSYFN